MGEFGLGDFIVAYTDVLIRWGSEVAMEGTSALLARDSASRWWLDVH